MRGPRGNIGQTGSDGIQGKQGETGSKGIKGDPGEYEAKGKDGTDGRDGRTGPQGQRGWDGKDGDPGLDGHDGSDGKTGAIGPVGEVGKDGTDGLDGLQGEKGKDGKIGKDGKDGKTGPKGDKGDIGKEVEKETQKAVTNIIAGGTSFIPRNKIRQTRDPGVTDDQDAGFLVLSRWINETDDKEFVCLDKTPGAAVWKETTGGGGGSSGHTIRDDGTDKTARTGLNFLGSILTVVDDAAGDETEIDIDETVIDHDALTNFDANEHILVAALDHDSLLNFVSNEHLLVAAIDHDSLLNFTSGEHFTMLDEDDLVSDSNTQAATQQSIKAYVDAASGGGSDKTREVFLVPRGKTDSSAGFGDKDDWTYIGLSSTSRTGFMWRVPPDYASLNKVTLVIIPDTTETIQIDFWMSICQPNVQWDDDMEQSLDITQAVVQFAITEIELAGEMAGFDDWTAGDYIAMRVPSDTSNVNPMGMIISYEVT